MQETGPGPRNNRVSRYSDPWSDDSDPDETLGSRDKVADDEPNSSASHAAQDGDLVDETIAELLSSECHGSQSAQLAVAKAEWLRLKRNEWTVAYNRRQSLEAAHGARNLSSTKAVGRSRKDEELQTLAEFLEHLPEPVSSAVGRVTADHPNEKEEWLRMRKEEWVLACKRRKALESERGAAAPRQWLPDGAELEEILKREWLRQRRVEHAAAMARRASLGALRTAAAMDPAPLVDPQMLSSPSEREAYLMAQVNPKRDPNPDPHSNPDRDPGPGPDPGPDPNPACCRRAGCARPRRRSAGASSPRHRAGRTSPPPPPSTVPSGCSSLARARTVLSPRPPRVTP